jgi:hypothetical protein
MFNYAQQQQQQNKYNTLCTYTDNHHEMHSMVWKLKLTLNDAKWG